MDNLYGFSYINCSFRLVSPVMAVEILSMDVWEAELETLEVSKAPRGGYA